MARCVLPILSMTSNLTGWLAEAYTGRPGAPRPDTRDRARTLLLPVSAEVLLAAACDACLSAHCSCPSCPSTSFPTASSCKAFHTFTCARSRHLITCYSPTPLFPSYSTLENLVGNQDTGQQEVQSEDSEQHARSAPGAKNGPSPSQRKRQSLKVTQQFNAAKVWLESGSTQLILSLETCITKDRMRK